MPSLQAIISLCDRVTAEIFVIFSALACPKNLKNRAAVVQFPCGKLAESQFCWQVVVLLLLNEVFLLHLAVWLKVKMLL